MNRRVVIVVVGLALVIVAAIVALVLTRGSAMPRDATSPTPNTSAPATELPGGDEVVTAGAYVEYSDTAVARAEGRVLLFFHAPWCPQCRAIEEDILDQGVPDGVTIIKVDYDSRQDLRQEYGVTLQTTFVEVDSRGAPQQSYVAYDDPRLDAVIAAML